MRGAKVGRGVSVEEDGNRMEELNLHRTKLWITLQLTGSANYGQMSVTARLFPSSSVETLLTLGRSDGRSDGAIIDVSLQFLCISDICILL